jgi:hypothetical protein
VAIRMLTTLSDSIISMCEAARSVSTFIKLSGAGGGGDMGQLVAGGTTRPPNMDSRVPPGEMRSMSSPSRAGSMVTDKSRRLAPAEIRKRRQRAGAAPPATPGGDRPKRTKVLHQELALPLLLSTGSALNPAGPWATFVKRYRSDVAEINLHFKTPLLRELCKRPSQWEPKIRVKYAMDWNPVSLVEQMTLFTTRMEASSIQILGTPQATSSAWCEFENGLFAHCIRDPATRRCGNCHWHGRSCSLDPDPAPVPLMRTSTRHISCEVLDRVIKNFEWANK